jgi:hypothetical protein
LEGRNSALPAVTENKLSTENTMNIKQLRQLIREELKEFKSSSESELEGRIRQVFLMDKWELSKNQYADLLKNLVKKYGKALVTKIVGELEKYGSIELKGSNKVVWNEAKKKKRDVLFGKKKYKDAEES